MDLHHAVIAKVLFAVLAVLDVGGRVAATTL